MRGAVRAKLVFLAAILGILALPTPGLAELLKGRLEVLGMTCEFCEKALEKRLRRVPGVAAARAWLDQGFATVTFTKEARLDVERLVQAVTDGGLTLQAIVVEAKGRIVEREGEKVLEVSQTGQRLHLQGPAVSSLAPGQEVTLSGLVEKAADGHRLVLILKGGPRG